MSMKWLRYCSHTEGRSHMRFHVHPFCFLAATFPRAVLALGFLRTRNGFSNPFPLCLITHKSLSALTSQGKVAKKRLSDSIEYANLLITFFFTIMAQIFFTK